MVSPELLRRYTFFAGLNDQELAGVAMVAEEVPFPHDAIIFHEGDLAARLYILQSGSVELIHIIQGPVGPQTAYVGSVAAGEPFGVSAFVEPYRFSATARADGATKVIVLEAQSLRAMSEVDCHLGYAIMRQVARTLAERLAFARIQLAAAHPG